MATKQVNIDIIAKDKPRQAMKSATVGINNLKQSVFNLQNALVGLGAGLVCKSFFDTVARSKDYKLIQVLISDVRRVKKLEVCEVCIKFLLARRNTKGAANLAVVSKDAEELNKF